MLSEWTPLPMDVLMTAEVIRHPTASPLAVLQGTATDGMDLTPFVDSIDQSSGECTVRLAWHLELYQSGHQPRPNEIVEVRMRGQVLWIGIITNITDYGESRGQRTMSFVARSRDKSNFWREAKVVTNAYPLGTDVLAIIEEICTFLNLDVAERVLPSSTGLTTVHSTTQAAMVSAWELLTIILQPIGGEPYVDALGRLKIISRAVDGVTTHTLTAERIKSVNGSGAVASVNRCRVKWLNPELTKTNNDDQVLANATITAGFFQDKVVQEIFFSQDRTQRAEGTRLVIKQSCNSGLLPVADEEYEQIDTYHGKITLDTNAFIQVLAGASLAEMLLAAAIPDGVAFYATIPEGRLIHAAAEAFIMLTMMSIGTGVYEVWGTPYDYVHETNTTEAYTDGTPDWSDNATEIENDFVMDDGMAQELAVRELLYANFSSRVYTIEIVDDPSIERGDIIEMPDTSRLYVLDYRRSIKRGQSHLLRVEGFRV